MKIAIIGGRDFNNYDMVKETMSQYSPTAIVSGGARGADSLARKYVTDNNIQLIEFLAEWDKYGRGAGFIRNKDIVANSDLVIAFWDGNSRGTQHSINLAKKANKELVVVRYENT